MTGPGFEIRKIWITGRPKGPYLGAVSMEIVFGVHVLQIRNMRLLVLNGRKVLQMPNRETKDGWQDVVFPANPETRSMLTDRAVEHFERMRFRRHGRG